MWVHKTIVVADAVVEQARSLCEQLAGTGGAGMFATALSADGNEPATHWISSGMIQEEFAQMLDNPELAKQTMTSLGIPVPDQFDALMASADISSEQADVATARLSLSLVTTPAVLQVEELP